MKKRFFCPLPALIGVAMLVGGCGTVEVIGSQLMGFDRNQPWTLLTGAEVLQAKSLAMGSAVTKGWEIADVSGRKLLVRRPLSSADAEAMAGEPISRPVVEVKTNFSKQRRGVAVSASAAVVGEKVTDKGKKARVRIDVTENYRNELNLSLGALQRSWEENRERAIAATRPPSTRDTKDTKDAGTEAPPDTTAGREIAAAASPLPAESTAAPTAASSIGDAVVPGEDQDTPPAIAGNPPGEGAVAPILAPNPGDTAGDTAAPVEERVVTIQPPITIPPSDRLSALNPTERSGAWGYYAEYHARSQGCEPLGGGATLEYKYPVFEVHRIHCNNGQNLLLSCNAGVCRKLRQDWVPPPAAADRSPRRLIEWR